MANPSCLLSECHDPASPRSGNLPEAKDGKALHLNLGTHHLVRKSALLLVAAVSMATIIVSQPASATTPASHSVGSSSIAVPHFSGSQGTVAAAPK